LVRELGISFSILGEVLIIVIKDEQKLKAKLKHQEFNSRVFWVVAIVLSKLVGGLA
jgi:hypothetical protein